MDNKIYIGASFPKLGILRMAVFRGETLPPQYRKMIEISPTAVNLIVPVTELAEKTRNLGKKGSKEYNAMMRLVDKISEVK